MILLPGLFNLPVNTIFDYFESSSSNILIDKRKLIVELRILVLSLALKIFLFALPKE